MAVVPKIESVFLEVLQALDLDELQTKTKTKFKKRQMALANHRQMMVEVFQDICRELELDIESERDLGRSLLEAGSFQAELENSVWTYGADHRQVLWFLLGYTWMPFLGRKIAFWQLDEIMDAGMPGGRFWYLPQVHQKDGKAELRMPVANVLDWFFDLSGIKMDKMSGCLGRGHNERTGTSEDTPQGIESNLYKWLNGKLPRATNIVSIFRDDCVIPFNGTFTADKKLKIEDRLETARQFLKHKGLTPDDLRNEIPLTDPGAIEHVLAGKSSEEVATHFIDLLSARYAVPTMATIRKRLHLARAIQHGYRKLVKDICPNVDETCADPSQNKVLQLLDIYKYVYNLTIQAHVECSARTEEDLWFESQLPPWCKAELFYSILPSLNSDSRTHANSVGAMLSKRFVELKGGERLDDLFGWDEQSEVEIIKRELCRWQEDIKRSDECQSLNQKIKSGSPWRTLQCFDDYEVIRSLLQEENISQRTRQLVRNKMREVAKSPVQQAWVILDELDSLLNRSQVKHQKNSRDLVEGLISELESHSSADIFRAELLRHKAKHSLLQNDFQAAEAYFRQALEACDDRNRGRQCGEIARDLFGLSVAAQPLIPSNHEKYYRYALYSGMFDENDPSMICLEDAAVAVADYFWRDLYQPYPDVKRITPRSAEQTEEILGQFLRLCAESNWEGVEEWAKKNSKFKDIRLRDVRGDTFISLFLKASYTIREQFSHPRNLLSKNEQAQIEEYLSNCIKALKLLVKLWPQSINLTDFKAQTPLMISANNGDVVMVQALVEAGADPSLQDYRGRTALHAAIAARSVKCTRIMLESGADTGLKTIDGQTVLHTAVRSGHPQLVELVKTKNPALMREKNADGLTPGDLLQQIIQSDFAEFCSYMRNEGRIHGSIVDYRKIAELLDS